MYEDPLGVDSITLSKVGPSGTKCSLRTQTYACKGASDVVAVEEHLVVFGKLGVGTVSSMVLLDLRVKDGSRTSA